VQFAEYLTYCRSLSFDSKPDMQYLRGLFRDLYVHQGYSSSGVEWDWDRFIQPYGGLGLSSAEEPLRPPPAPTRPLTSAARAPDAMDTTHELKTGPTPSAQQQQQQQQPADMVVADPHRWRATTAPASTLQHQHALQGPPHAVPAEPQVVMMQTEDAEEPADAHATSPLNKLKQSLRISDDDARQGHKRHLSASKVRLSPCHPFWVGVGRHATLAAVGGIVCVRLCR
jgi:hypothetical protein